MVERRLDKAWVASSNLALGTRIHGDQMIDVNVEQAKSELWKNRVCARCGRGTADTVLNIEAVIHHNASYSKLECVDRKACQKQVKRNK